MADIETVDVAGRVVLLRGAESIPDQGHGISSALVDRGADLVLHLGIDQDLAVVDEDVMRANGWVRG